LQLTPCAVAEYMHPEPDFDDDPRCRWKQLPMETMVKVKNRNSLWASAVALVCALLSSRGALAQVATQTCDFLPNKIYLHGTTAVKPLIAVLGARLAALPTPYTLLYQQVDACNAVSTVANNANISQSGAPHVYSLAQTPKNPDAYKDDTCTLNAGSIIAADVGLADVYFNSCPIYSPDTLRDPNLNPASSGSPAMDFLGPIQAMVFVTPQSNFSSQYLLMEEAQDILACGTGAKVYPYIDPKQLNLYDHEGGFTNGVPLMTYDCLNLPTSYYPRSADQAYFVKPSFYPQPEIAIIGIILSSINPSAAIGFVSGENYDEHRDTLKSLAIVGPGQGAGNKAYLPDFDATTRDRRNVRDGHYTIQGPLHMIARVGADNVPSSPMAQRFINWMQGKPGMPGEDPLPFNILDIFATTGVVPQCAMKVIRASECGPFKPYKDAAPCGCYFESKATGVAIPGGCTPCTSAADCSGGRMCSFGFCE
jgi:hypothetical protein